MRRYSCLLLLLLFLGSPAWAAPIVTMFFRGAIGPTPGFFLMEVDGVLNPLLCDQFLPNVTTEPYQAIVATLDDLTGTTLERQGDPNALQKYQLVALINLRAYQDASLASDAVRASRFVVDGFGPMPNSSLDLLAWAQAQNPADYPELAGFKIYANPITQELTGYDVPEPATVILIAGGLLSFAVVRRRRVPSR